MEQGNQSCCQVCKEEKHPSRLTRNREGEWCCDDCYMDTTTKEFPYKLLRNNGKSTETGVLMIPNGKEVK